MSTVAENKRPTRRPTFISRLKWWWIFLTWYVLSIGPLYWQWHHATVQGEGAFFEVFYRPLVYACEFRPFGAVVNAYIELWVM